MSIDLGGGKKDTESRLCTPSYVSASQTKCEDSKGLNFSYSTSSNKQDSEAVPCRDIDGDLKLQSLAKSSKNGEVISVGMQSTISSSKPTDDSKDVRSISATSTAESDVWRDQNSLKTKSKFSLNLEGSKKDQANPGAQFSPFLGTATPNFGLANKGKSKGIHSGNEDTKIRGHENYEGLQVTNKKQSKVSRSKGDDIRSNIDLQYAGKVGFYHQKDELEHRGLFSSESRVMGSQRTVVDSEQSEISSSLRSRASSGSQFKGSENDSLSSHPKWRSLVSSDEARKLGSSSGSTVKDSKYQKLNFERQVSNPERFNGGQCYSDETDSVIGNHKTILTSKFAAQAPCVTYSFSLQPTSIGLRVQTKGNHDLNDELKVKADELEKRFPEHKLQFPGDSNSTKRNRITDMPSELVATSSYKELVIDAAPVQLPTKHSLDDHAGGFSYAVNFNSSTLLKLSANQTSGNVLSNHISESSFTESSRGNHYETYVRKRNDKLKDDWTSRRVEKEAKLKAMQDSFERSAAEVKAKFSGSTDRMDPVSTAHQHAERLRSFNTRSTIMVEQKQLDFGQSDDEYLRNSKERKYGQDRSFNEEDISKSATTKELFPSKSLSSSTSRTTTAPIPKSANIGSGSGRRKLQPENPLAQSAPNFFKLRKENTKPYTAGFMEVPENSKVHPVFHVSLLKKHIKRTSSPTMELPTLLPDGSFPIYPVAILNRRTVLRGRIYVYQLFIQWNHSSPNEATWEDYHFVWKKFPAFLGVKEIVREGECHDNKGIIKQGNQHEGKNNIASTKV